MLTREEAKRRAELYSALAKGKSVQVQGIDGSWVDVDIDKLNYFIETPIFRIKPEPKYRPFKTQEECWNEMLKHQPFGWLKSKENEFCINIGEVSWKEGYGDVVITFYTSKPFSLYSNAAYREYTFADGTPFGIREE